MEKFILDTNLFFNMGANLGIGDNTEKIVVNLTEKMLSLKKTGSADFFMPPGAVQEFLSFFENKEQSFLKNFLSALVIKSPDISKINFPANLFYKIIEDIRARSYKGLNIAEEEIENAGRLMADAGDLTKKDFQIKVGGVIKKFRERYRNATRSGFLDSLVDLDLIVLAHEQGGYLVTTDEGVLSWGRSFGVKEMPSSVFLKRLADLQSQGSRHQE